MHDRLLGSTFDGGRFRVEKRLQGEGLRQLFLGLDTESSDAVLISYDKLPKHTTIAGFVAANKAQAPGVLELLFAGTPDDEASYWGVIERVPRSARWLPEVIGPHDLAKALALGRSAGTILAEAAARGTLLARARPETMWITGDTVAGLSQRSELMFAASWVTTFTMPVFDRYYCAPEVTRKQTVDDRALVFTLSMMIAEWATGLYPFAKKSFDSGPLEDDQVALDLPAPLATLLHSGMQISALRRPDLATFLSALRA